MPSFIIRKLKKNLELTEPLIKIEGFRYVPKFKNNNSLKIKEITIVNKKIIDSLIIASFDQKYKKILELYLKALSEADDASTEGNLMLALDEIARLRTIIIKKYQKTISKKNTEKLLKKLKILENELRVKIIDYKMILEQQKSPKVSQGKGR